MKQCCDTFGKKPQNCPQMKSQELLSIPVYLTSHLVLLNSACFSIYEYYYNISSESLTELPYIPWLLMIGNCLVALSELHFQDKFYSLQIFLDYLQTVLTLPCITANFWLYFQLGPPELCYLHVAFAFLCIFIFVLQDYQRQELTDFAVLSNFFSLLIAGALYKNYWAILAALNGAFAYVTFKRSESVSPNDQQKYNFAMTIFNMLALYSFSDKV